MTEFEELIEIGRAFSSSRMQRGSLIKLKGKEAFISNSNGTLICRLTFHSDIGEGSFYAGEAPMNSKSVSLRGDKVVFEFLEKEREKRIFVPDKSKSIEGIEEVFKKYYKNPSEKIPLRLFKELSEEIIITNILIHEDKIDLSQKRSDGSVEIQTTLKLSSGLSEVFHKGKDEITIFTNDLLPLGKFFKDVFINLETGGPISLKGDIENGKLEVIIAPLKYQLEKKV